MPEEIRITAYHFEELNEGLQMQIMEGVAGEFLRKYINDLGTFEVENPDLHEKVRKAINADNYKLIKHGIIDLAYDYVSARCRARRYLEDGRKIT